nr:hypothetical protein [Micromonospora provocatoris]
MVAEQVVQLAGDPQPLLGGPVAGLLLLTLLRGQHPGLHLGEIGPPVTGHADDDRDQPAGVQQRRAVATDTGPGVAVGDGEGDDRGQAEPHRDREVPLVDDRVQRHDEHQHDRPRAVQQSAVRGDRGERHQAHSHRVSPAQVERCGRGQDDEQRDEFGGGVDAVRLHDQAEQGHQGDGRHESGPRPVPARHCRSVAVRGRSGGPRSGAVAVSWRGREGRCATHAGLIGFG